MHYDVSDTFLTFFQPVQLTIFTMKIPFAVKNIFYQILFSSPGAVKLNIEP